jgi:pimeloyl-ACP methyl ester carboxylesterase
VTFLAHSDLGERSSEGDLRTLVVLHGLYGSSRNWRAVGRGLGAGRRVLALDLPNHGASPRHADCSYAAQARAVSQTLDSLGEEEVDLMGHSMGGKVAMALACREPQRVAHLLVLDIGPWAYRPDPDLLAAMIDLPLTEITSRGEAERWLAERVQDRPTQLFLLTNLVRREEDAEDDPGGEGVFRWQLGLAELAADFSQIGASPLRAQDHYGGAASFLAGGESDYLAADDLERIRRHFPAATLEFLPGVGHNVHVEGGDRFLAWVAERTTRG